MTLIPTPSQTVGPYLHIGLTDTRAIGCVAKPGAKGERVWLKLRLLDGEGVPVPDGMIEIWQANAEGKYHHPEDTTAGSVDPLFLGFGRLATGEDGSCSFETIKPGPVPAPAGGFQAPHLNLGIFGRGLLKRLATRAYFAGDPANANDPVLALVPDDLRFTLMAQPDGRRPGAWWLDLHLGGDAETVFFDV